MGLLCVLVSSFVVLLIWKGRVLRKHNLVAGRTEDGVQVLAQENGSEGGQERPEGRGLDGDYVVRDAIFRGK